jgi:predicted membrane chloride channel (bestrophin family)
MKTINIKSDMPDRLEAGRRLSAIISENRQKEKVIKIVHGYGSTGVGGTIKHAVRRSLRNRKKKGEIKAYIPGEAFQQLMGFDEVIATYKHLLKHDSDFNKMNEGITYVIL